MPIISCFTWRVFLIQYHSDVHVHQASKMAAAPPMHQSTTISDVKVIKSGCVLLQQRCVVSVKLVVTQNSQDTPKQFLFKPVCIDSALQLNQL